MTSRLIYLSTLRCCRCCGWRASCRRQARALADLTALRWWLCMSTRAPHTQPRCSPASASGGPLACLITASLWGSNLTKQYSLPIFLDPDNIGLRRAAYLPLDPAWPLARLRGVLQDARPCALLWAPASASGARLPCACAAVGARNRERCAPTLCMRCCGRPQALAVRAYPVHALLWAPATASGARLPCACAAVGARNRERCVPTLCMRCCERPQPRAVRAYPVHALLPGLLQLLGQRRCCTQLPCPHAAPAFHVCMASGSIQIRST